MRAIVIAAGAFILASCGGNDVPSPSEREATGLTAPDPVADEAVVLQRKGLKAGSEGFFFGAGKNEAIASATKQLNAPLRTIANEECSTGPMETTDFEGGLSLNFSDQVLVGWLLRSPQDGDRAPAVPISLQGDVQLGTPRGELEASDGYLAIPESTLGEEFALGDAIGGFVEDDAVSMLYAGLQCFAR